MTDEEILALENQGLLVERFKELIAQRDHFVYLYTNTAGNDSLAEKLICASNKSLLRDLDAV